MLLFHGKPIKWLELIAHIVGVLDRQLTYQEPWTNILYKKETVEIKMVLNFSKTRHDMDKLCVTKKQWIVYHIRTPSQIEPFPVNPCLQVQL